MFQLSYWKTIPILLTILAGIIFALPNTYSEKFRDSLPRFIPSSPMVLGLDLQGGSHIVLEVDRKKFTAELLKQQIGDLRHALRNELKVQYIGLGRKSETSVGFQIKNAADVEKATPVLRRLRQNASEGGILNQSLGLTDGAGNFLFDLDIDGQKVTYTFSTPGLNAKIGQAIQHILKILNDRINSLGTTEPTIQRQGVDRILVQVPGLKDPERLIAVIGQTAKLTFQLLCDSQPTGASQRPPLDCEELLERDTNQPMWLKTSRNAIVSGEDLVDAQPAFDQQNGQPIVSFRFNTKGALKFGELTTKNVHRRFAIVLDGKVVSAPVIQSPIPGGSGQISGNFTVQEANNLAIVLRSGALPAELVIVERRTVGASLGQDSIDAGFMASIIGLIGIVIFMLVVYGTFGAFANLALFANLSLLIGILSALGATLTLPGIAGIVLTMGMAVDSNVLVFERIREEIRAGRSPLNSIDTGFQRALATILDANFTTFIAAFVLFGLGSGPVKGFAVTLGIGIITTVFTAFTFTRLVVALWARWQRPKSVPIDTPLRFLMDDTKIKFMKYARLGIGGSAIAVVASIVLFFAVGLNLGIDFKGGTLIEIRTADQKAANIGELRDKLGALGLGEVELQTFGKPSDVLIRIETQPGGEKAQQTAIEKVKAALGDKVDYRRDEVVGPKVSGELTQEATIAVIAAILAVMFYIWFRFEWQFSVGAVASLTHDVLLTIGVFSILRIEFGLPIIAAILTIVGYSLNDTVVVYDRVRENMRKFKKMPVSGIIDLSLNQMLRRTLVTSLSTLVALGALYTFGGEVLRGFTFTMIWGVVIGTYSSIFIAAPLLIQLAARLTDTEDEQEGAPGKA